MSHPMLELNAEVLLQRVSDRIPVVLRDNAVVIGSIATAWAFRDISHTSTVATKDIDLLLCPSVDAVLTAWRTSNRPTPPTETESPEVVT